MLRAVVWLLLATLISCNQFKLTSCTTEDCAFSEVPDPSLIEGDNSCDPAARPFGFGTGTRLNPYRICTIGHFLNLELFPAPNTYFRQTTSLNFSATTFSPFGDGVIPFEGKYDGLNHILLDLEYNSPTDPLPVGLFRILGSGAEISNVKIMSIDITGNDHTGGLAGQASGFIKNVTVSGLVTGNGHVGGLVGSQFTNGLIISESQTSATILSLATSLLISNTLFDGRTTLVGAGGIIGTSSYDMTLDKITSSSDVTFTSGARGNYTNVGAGGIVGTTAGKNSLIQDSTSSGVITSGFNAGGIIGAEGSGNAETFVANSSTPTPALYRRLGSTATVRGLSIVGGIMGYMNGGTIHQSYYQGTIIGKVNTGGILGASLGGGITESFSSGEIREIDGTTSCESVGGVLGESFTTAFNHSFIISDSFTSMEISLSCSNGSGLNISSFSGKGAENTNELYTRVASFVTVTSSPLTAFGNSNSLQLVKSIYIQGPNVPSDPTASSIPVTDPLDLTQYIPGLDLALPIWKMTTTNPFSSFNHPIPAWACTLSGVNCI